MCDSKGVIYKGRKNIDQFKSAFAVDTKLRTLDEAIKEADVFLGLSQKMLLQKEMVKSMAKKSNYLCLCQSRSRNKTRIN